MKEFDHTQVGGIDLFLGGRFMIFEAIDESPLQHVNPPLSDTLILVLVELRTYNRESFSLLSRHMYGESTSSTMGEMGIYLPSTSVVSFSISPLSVMGSIFPTTPLSSSCGIPPITSMTPTFFLNLFVSMPTSTFVIEEIRGQSMGTRIFTASSSQPTIPILNTCISTYENMLGGLIVSSN